MYTDIDTALKAKLGGIMVSGPGGPASLAVGVLIKNPEEEFKGVAFPSLVVSLFDVRYQPRRQYREPTVRNETGTAADVYKASVPYDLHYQVMTLALFQQQDREMNLQVVRRLPAPEAVLDVNGHKLSVMFNGYAVADTVGAEGKRVFKKVSSYIVETEMDETEFQNVKKVLTVETNVHPGLTVLP